MKMTFVELRRDPAKLMEALERNEEVTLSRRGREVARVIPSGQPAVGAEVKNHPAFGMWADRDDAADPAAYVRNLRKGRFVDL
ncbi:MAG: type II toxin-antitoxin system prevent-host-death family antitoxin [Sumerlaeia bacterium]